MSQLIVNSAEGGSIVHELTGNVVTIGRVPDNDIVLNEPSVSSHHAAITCKNDACHLYDLNSSNGTTVNGQPVTQVDLKDGDILRFGGVESTFSVAPATQAIVVKSIPSFHSGPEEIPLVAPEPPPWTSEGERSPQGEQQENANFGHSAQRQLKAIYAFFTVILIGFFGCAIWFNHARKRVVAAAAIVVVTPKPLPVVTPEPRTAIRLESQPVTTPKPKAITATSPGQHLAPNGTFWLTHRVSATTDSGVIGVPVGTKVTLVRYEGTALRVTDGQHEFDVAQPQVTNDLDLARQVFNADQRAQSQMATIEEQATRDGRDRSQKSAQQPTASQSQRPQFENGAQQAEAGRQARIASVLNRIRHLRQDLARYSSGHAAPGDHQYWINQDEAEIRQLQEQLDQLGVAGAFQ
jgi:pSer/pThr/pTyr-binding forkhead associated (FHA) protein